MKKPVYYYSLLAVLLILNSFFALSQQQNNVKLEKFEFTYDNNNNCTASNIIDKDFFKINTSLLNNGIKNGTYWFKLTVVNYSNKTQPYVFEIKDPYSDTATIYIKEGSQLEFLYQSGKSVPLKKKPIPKRFVAFPLKINPGTHIYYIKMIFPRYVHFEYRLIPEQKYYTSELTTYAKIFIYYGIVIMLIIINLFYFISFKEKSFLYYTIALFSISIILLELDGLMIFILEPGWLLNNIDILAYMSLVFFGCYVFAANFLELRINIPYSLKIEIPLIISPILLFILFLITYNISYFAGGVITMLLCLSYYWATSLLIIKKYRHALYFSIAYSIILLTAIGFVISIFMDNSMKVDHDSLKVGGLIEMLILSYALVKRMQLLQKENDQMHKSIQEYLCELEEIKENQHPNSINGNNHRQIQMDALPKVKEKFCLTDREVDVLREIILEKTNKEIADSLYVSINTVKFHTKNIYKKLDISGRMDVKDELHKHII